MTEQPDQEQEQEPIAPILETAFLCYINTEGHWMVTPEVHLAAELQIKRPATPDDLYMGVCMVKKDLEVWETASRSVQLHQQATSATIEKLAEQRAAQQIQQAAKMGGAVDLSAFKSQ